MDSCQVVVVDCFRLWRRFDALVVLWFARECGLLVESCVKRWSKAGRRNAVSCVTFCTKFERNGKGMWKGMNGWEVWGFEKELKLKLWELKKSLFRQGVLAAFDYFNDMEI